MQKNKQNPSLKSDRLKSKLLIIVAISILLVFSSARQVKADSITPEKVFELINAARNKEGLKPLTINSQLSEAAYEKAQDMTRNNYFAHVSPSGKTPWNWIDGSGYYYKYAGENLAMDYKTAEDQQKAWMNSPTHKKNILNSNYTETGIATASGLINGQLANITVQEFGSPMNVIKVEKDIAPEKTEPKPVPIVAGEQKTNLPIASVKKTDSLPVASGATIQEFLSRVATNVANEKSLISLVLSLLAVYILGLIFSAFAALHGSHGHSSNNDFTARPLSISEANAYAKIVNGISLDENDMKTIYLWQMKMKK